MARDNATSGGSRLAQGGVATNVDGSALMASQRMRVAYLLTLVGGYLDAYTYLLRGGVFANAQTGNIVKLGLAFSEHARETYLRFLVPIGAFTLGLLAALALRENLERRGIRLVRRGVLVAEAAVLALVGVIPLGGDWDWLANALVSFVAAMQYETFTTFRGDAIVTTMSTGNLRKMVDALFWGVARRDTEQVGRALVFLSIIATFTLGAVAGARCCEAFGRLAVLPPIGCLLLVVGIITALRRRAQVVREVHGGGQG